MKDLIKKLNIYECEYETNSLGIIFLKDCYLKEDIDNILNQHNIITAPKSIKLSEIVSRLNCYVKHIENTIHLYTIEEDLFDEYDTFESYSLIIKDNKIINVLLSQCDEFKWLYALWIAGTTIIDDLEELDNAKD